MKAKMQIIGAVTLVLVVALGAWNVAFAEKGPEGSLFSQLLQARPSNAQSGTRVPQAAGALQAIDDNPHPEDLTPEVEHTSEVMDAHDAADDNGGQGEVEAHAEITGTISAIDGTTVTINGQVFNLAPNAEGAASVQVGDTVKLEFVRNPDGTTVVREVKLADAPGNSSESSQSTDDSSISHESGDDSGGHGSHGGGKGGGGGGSDDGSGG
jgi:uncharacterized protein DUF5666